MTTTPNTPRDESPSDEIGVDDHRTRELPAGEAAVSEASAPATPPPGSAPTAPQRSEPSAPSATATATATAIRPTPGATTAAAVDGPAAAEPTYLRGPAPFAIILGILGLLVAGLTLVGELTDLSIPWDDLGPWTVVAAGIVVLLVGAIGLRASRTQD